MRVSRISWFVAAALFLATGHAARAQSDDGMQCGSRLVTLGETKAEVLLKCGEPMLKEMRGDPYGRLQVVEEWTYHMGKGRFLRILTFRYSRVISIKAGAFIQRAR